MMRESRIDQVLRLATVADAAAVAEIYRPAVAERATSFELTPPDAAEMARRIERTLARTPWLVCERDGAVVGFAYASPHRERPAYQWSVEVSVYIAAAAHRGGVARALYTALFAILALQGFRTALAGVTLPNPPSVRLHEAVGFTQLGVFRNIGYKLGQWHDVAWFERPLAEPTVDPPEPRPLPEVLGEPAFAAALGHAPGV